MTSNCPGFLPGVKIEWLRALASYPPSTDSFTMQMISQLSIVTFIGCGYKYFKIRTRDAMLTIMRCPLMSDRQN